ncbi:erg26, C-3 sterol dehydrogenase [Orbilia oligospora]|uniref:Erg26, C-3 sterol dehydrogenase n=1 Tax=Orbilia oligospora TaxID=2813651 RepID=A0A7C8U9P9_ORBOL|nr:erg26, C-3 sterol dehydrogenase [Orbilia oligospora]
MASLAPNQTPIASCLVIGGCGFLGSAIVNSLLQKHPKCRITAADIRLTNQLADSNVKYVTVDITDLSSITSVIENAKPEAVIHTASPVHGLGREIYMKVNVDGTKNVVKACEATGVKVMVYTSSAGVVFDGSPLVNVDETEPFPIIPYDAYNESKAIAETVALEANGSNGMLTTALRPAGIFGPGDRQLVPGFITVVKNRQTQWQLGNNTNLFDFTYIDNLAIAHVLAASVLLHQHATTGVTDPSVDQRKRLDGTSIFVTNGQPVYFWDFAKAIWCHYGVYNAGSIVLPRSGGLVIAGLAELFSKLMGREPGLTRFRVKFSCAHRYFDIRKAKDLLGYEPEVSLTEGLRRCIEWFKAEEEKTAAAAAAPAEKQ